MDFKPPHNLGTGGFRDLTSLPREPLKDIDFTSQPYELRARYANYEEITRQFNLLAYWTTIEGQRESALSSLDPERRAKIVQVARLSIVRSDAHQRVRDKNIRAEVPKTLVPYFQEV